MSEPAHEKINLNRPYVTVRGGEVSGVYMYIDEPGVYFSAKGDVIPEEMARKAGFEVDEHKKQAKIAELTAEKKAKIDAEMAVLEEQAAQEVLSESQAEKQMIPEDVLKAVAPEYNAKDQLRATRDLEMDHIGGGLFNVLEKESGKMILARERGAECAKVMVKWHQERGDLEGDDAS